ncbi:MAG: hypothetical protein R8K46_04105 [Mariprofundaceae bacterium]
MGNVQSLPGIFPLAEDRDFLSEREWTCLRLVCHDKKTIADAEPEALSRATAGQINATRAAVLIQTARIASLPGLGSWIARLMAEAGWCEQDIRCRPAADIMIAINRRTGYAICNRATEHALGELQTKWPDAPSQGGN